MRKPDLIDRYILADLVDANGNVHWEDIANVSSAVDLFPLLTEEEKQQNRWYAEGYGDAIRELSVQPDRGYIEQIKWERDLAIRQLADLGYGLGEKPRTNGDSISRQTAIDAMCDACSDWCDEGVCKKASAIQRLPSAQPEIIKCKDCKHLYQDNGCPLRTWWTHTEEDFCSYAERREE